ncbi:MAG: hypothetical protein A3C85_01350 [Candidatus Doudnabacteria bacterium RIFCSPHIGHO2_02_FULL_48_21]|uniref:Uncharacterized protein n=1 Tax=Candidatus Doudnabacteria bacterium RIFCSPLOWO2_02_FULL_48_13 TaxID=1817845 RepID=A0A1F5QAA8_9BACT|nr:MAG: hypothetical protein A3K05_04395 [Candidatus Doudnabacteria bacterium RIFCSPHIGHO2_01_48_18]OGE79603.1 MAG: hypothetical protein A2668_03405 [Candidatus Doudnabacteria bacterium RIFCSPHIGHO2_01_FULL_48_180]OGE91130.1 MAG: hypothetical protein A3F44_02290 [Candidatus Doudnabacteria bacterium RIFCSPHIGHO2_12_FULL_47_25]OGE93820.1 MAG: hypothetical protein A3C85_01350 [Candidatus Doudnabacteria bacterium RIFCSPHIGHO2_02_FULL_48_21]OGE98006.1 MAG: hypothetical protein A3A83_00935 [Candidatu
MPDFNRAKGEKSDFEHIPPQETKDVAENLPDGATAQDLQSEVVTAEVPSLELPDIVNPEPDTGNRGELHPALVGVKGLEFARRVISETARKKAVSAADLEQVNDLLSEHIEQRNKDQNG